MVRGSKFINVINNKLIFMFDVMIFINESLIERERERERERALLTV